MLFAVLGGVECDDCGCVGLCLVVVFGNCDCVSFVWCFGCDLDGCLAGCCGFWAVEFELDCIVFVLCVFGLDGCGALFVLGGVGDWWCGR